MSNYFEKVKGYLLDLGFAISKEDKQEELVVIKDEEKGINNLIIDCEDPILVLEQPIFKIQKDDPNIYKRLLQMNRCLLHGAFVLDETGETVLFRDTLQLENLDLNELDGSIQSLSMGLAEFSDELLSFAKKE